MISIIHPSKAVNVSLALTGSKSITNRLLILRSIYSSIRIENKSESQDTVLLDKALNTSSNVIDISHAGTAMRFLTAYYSILENKEIVLKGSKRMHERPIYPLVDCLRAIGADITYLEKTGFPPLKIKGKKLNFNKVQISSGISSQFISAILLIAPKLHGGLELELKGELISKPYIKMTLSILDNLGVKSSFKNKSIIIENSNEIPEKNISVESDWSSASYWYSIVSLCKEAKVNLRKFHKKSIQGDSVLSKFYRKLGVETKFVDNEIRLTKKDDIKLPNNLSLDLIDCPDLAQTIAVSCFGLGVGCELEGLQTLNIKETKRLIALESELKKLGAKVDISNNSLKLFESKKIKQNITIKTYQDHRMAMSFAPLAIKTPILIENPNVVIKSYPNFWEDLNKAGFRIKLI
tara:strand:+ start:5 stop:1228 length:1224 start_codon:yes stop_codon:yes gene_type:complete